MQSYEEFEAHCNSMDKELADEKARQCKFIDSLEKALINLSLHYYPETEQHKQHFIESLTQKAHMRAVGINELLDCLLYGIISNEQSSVDNYKVPERDVAQREKQFLEDTLKNMPPEQHEFFIKLHVERVKRESEEREFLFQCHGKAKELLWQYFPEIANFSGTSIRNINHTAYIYMTEYIADFYYYAGEYLNEE